MQKIVEFLSRFFLNGKSYKILYKRLSSPTKFGIFKFQTSSEIEEHVYCGSYNELFFL